MITGKLLPRALVLTLGFGLMLAAQNAGPTPAPRAPRRAAANFTPPPRSPQVNPDRSVTFHLRAPNAREVFVQLEGADGLFPMRNDGTGEWSATIGPLAPEIYGYEFIVDGQPRMDPTDPLVKTNLLFPQSMVNVAGVVPGDPTEPWELTDVPHGVVHHQYYHSAIVGDNRDFYVYTPPNYNPRAGETYPVLYLLHGYSDGADGWTTVGRANLILDNLIAQGKVKPMIVVMTLGYGQPKILDFGWTGFSHPEVVKQNFDRYRSSLLQEVMPMIDRDYRAKSDADDTAIAGLSMGGAESLLVGLNDLDRFAYVGAFSAGGEGNDYAAEFPNLTAAEANRRLRLLWIACGTEDHLIGPNRRLREWLTSRGIRHVNIETPGMHTWMVWRNDLVHFLPLLFQK